MTNPRQVVRDLVESISPFDTLEEGHKDNVLQWIDNNFPLFRISKPDNPPKHLVSYFVLYDAQAQSVMLIDHLKAKLWLPTGGHVDIDEDPYNAVVREADEELKIVADFNTVFGSRPFFITVTETKNAGVHTDVSLWYVIKGSVNADLEFDTNEMNGIRWQTLEEVLETSIDDLDPHMHRFTSKMREFLN